MKKLHEKLKNYPEEDRKAKLLQLKKLMISWDVCIDLKKFKFLKFKGRRHFT